ncbi:MULTISPECIES: hypothetical protein [Amycolatopsis]|uniref:WXG100 family type VII secretion target n=1 Tax=Amycolatopsis albidoflavus TaxID=102226 RepID=A0ABW5I7H9_9PSEU
MAPPEKPAPGEHLVDRTDPGGYAGMYPDATEQVFRALAHLQQTYHDTLGGVRKDLQQEYHVGNGASGKAFMETYREWAISLDRNAQLASIGLAQLTGQAVGQIAEYRTADAKNAAGLRSSQTGQ